MADLFMCLPMAIGQMLGGLFFRNDISKQYLTCVAHPLSSCLLHVVHVS